MVVSNVSLPSWSLRYYETILPFSSWVSATTKTKLPAVAKETALPKVRLYEDPGLEVIVEFASIRIPSNVLSATYVRQRSGGASAARSRATPGASSRGATTARICRACPMACAAA